MNGRKRLLRELREHEPASVLEATMLQRIIAFVEESEFFLVETLAEKITQIIIIEFGVPWVRLTLNKKGAIRGASDVGILIERGEKPGHA